MTVVCLMIMLGFPGVTGAMQAQTHTIDRRGWHSFVSPKGGFELQYPPSFVNCRRRDPDDPTSWEPESCMSYAPVCGIPDKRDETLACIALPRSDYRGTNFEAAAISVNMLKIAGNSCPTSSGEPEHSEIINGLTFAVSWFGGGAAGNEIYRSEYRIFHSNRCYEIDLSVAYANIGNYDPGTVKEFDLNRTKELLKQVLETFRFVK